jgi:hypothetical protein
MKKSQKNKYVLLQKKDHLRLDEDLFFFWFLKILLTQEHITDYIIYIDIYKERDK